MSDDFGDTQTAEAIRDAAGERLAHYFDGEELKPFSFAYEAAFHRIPMDGDVEASVMLIFLLTQDKRTVDRETRGDAIETFRDKMNEWATAKGISCVTRGGVFNDVTTRAIAKANEIWDEAQASAFKPKASGKGAPSDPNA